LIDQYQDEKATLDKKKKIYEFYMSNLHHVNNWNLVDASAYFITGAHLENVEDKSILITLASSSDLWERRVSIVATLHFIRKNSFDWTFTIAKLLLKDSHDLIHKATGWMLREVGKKNKSALVKFLEEHAEKMHRTTLRYSIERLDDKSKKKFMNIKNNSGEGRKVDEFKQNKKPRKNEPEECL
jgi:3-methyladenine DNA glycosylase AlkD